MPEPLINHSKQEETSWLSRLVRRVWKVLSWTWFYLVNLLFVGGLIFLWGAWLKYQDPLETAEPLVENTVALPPGTIDTTYVRTLDDGTTITISNGSFGADMVETDDFSDKLFPNFRAA